MILVTSANGHVGSKIVKAAAALNLPVRAFGLSEGPNPADRLSGVDYLDGDFFDPPTLRRAFDGVDQVFHIAPPEHPREFAIGQSMIDLAAEFKVRQFCFFSVIHPYIAALAHHRMKLLVQQYLLESGLPYTILQPTIFLQTAGIEKVLQTGTWTTPYSADTPMSYVDQDDVAEAAALILTEGRHLRATYELVGTDPISIHEMAALITQQKGRKVTVEVVPAQGMIDKLPRTSVEDVYKADALERMMMYYNRHGLTGNSYALESLLGRKPTNFLDYLKKMD